MATRADGYEMYNPGSDSNTIRNNKDHSKYFQQDEKSGEYVLKEGYEQRFLGSGDYVDSGGAESTFSNDYDDMHDSYEPDRDKKVYGIYKKQQAQKAAPETQQAAPVAEKPKDDLVIKQRGPTKYSPEIKDAKSRAKNWQSMANGYEQDTAAQQSFAQAESLDLSKYQFNAGQ